MKYANQNDYPYTQYPSRELPKATVKSGGCGCVCSVNVLRFFGVDMTVEEMAKTFVQKGIRVNGGTDMNAAAKYLKNTYGVEYITTNDENVLAAKLNQGCIAVANCDGDIGAKGIFSTGGHFFNVIGYDNTPPKPFICFDVGYYSGKFDTAYRNQYVTVSKDSEGNIIQYTSQEALNLDTQYNSPQYWIFYKEDIDMEELKKMQERVTKLEEQLNVKFGYVDDYMYEWAREPVQTLIDEGILKGNEQGNLQLSELKLWVCTLLGRVVDKFKK